MTCGSPPCRHLHRTRTPREPPAGPLWPPALWEPPARPLQSPAPWEPSAMAPRRLRDLLRFQLAGLNPGHSRPLVVVSRPKCPANKNNGKICQIKQ
jgi:hypothetical protein